MNTMLPWKEQDYRNWLLSLPENTTIGSRNICPIMVWRGTLGERVAVCGRIAVSSDEKVYDIPEWVEWFEDGIDDIRFQVGTPEGTYYVPVTVKDCLNVLNTNKLNREMK